MRLKTQKENKMILEWAIMKEEDFFYSYLKKASLYDIVEFCQLFPDFMKNKKVKCRFPRAARNSSDKRKVAMK